MRSIVIFLLLLLAAYGLWEYIEDREAMEKTRIELHRKDPKTAEPTPTPEPTPAAPASPNLDEVQVKGGAALTHATVKAVRASGVVFLCDQGLVEVPFGSLPANLAAYFSAMLPPTPSPTPTPDGAASQSDSPATPVPTPTPVPPPKPHTEKSFQQDTQDRLAFIEARQALRDRIKTDQDIIDHWYKQSSFEKNGYVSESQFNSAKADQDAAIAQLNQLEAGGPGS